jgi:magnesium transporter
MMPLEQTQPCGDVAVLVEAGDSRGLSEVFRDLRSEDIPRVVTRLDPALRTRLVDLVEPDVASTIVRLVEDFQAAELMEGLAPERAAAIIQGLPSNDAADLLGHFDDARAAAVLAEVTPGLADTLRTLTAYPPNTAGGLMVTEYLAYPREARVSDVIQDLRENAPKYASYHVQYVYVLGMAGRLSSVVRVRDLLLSSPDTRLGSLTPIRPTKVNHLADLDTLREIFDRVPFVGLPVVDDEDVLKGVVRRLHLEEALADRTAGELRQAFGIVGGEEVRTMPALLRSRRRLSWLSVNIVLNVIAASVIVFFEETLAQVIALAVFLPIISDMSGCSGNQAVAVTLRELSLGLVRVSEVARVWAKELTVGVVNGFVLGLLIGTAAWLWKGDPLLGVVVGTAMAVNTLVAVSIGGVVPLALRRFGFDPALASGPILTTITDMCGFFLVLGLATLFLARLVQ